MNSYEIIYLLIFSTNETASQQKNCYTYRIF